MDIPLRYLLCRLRRGFLARLSLRWPCFVPLLGKPVPLAPREYKGSAAGRSLIIFLPGIGDLAEDFERRGFIDDLRRHQFAADVVALDAHYGYYAAREIHERLRQDVILDARAAGYEQIWLAGISLGGFGAASYAARYPSHIDGLLLFAPYLGNDAIVDEIVGAGGIANWQPGVAGKGDHQRRLWAWFKHRSAGGNPALPIYLGYGRRDIFARANSLLSGILPRAHVFPVEGGHDWRAWRAIWQLILSERKTFYESVHRTSARRS
jgi:pimeloyl-ACP methyl ester carboxylesterase